MEITTLAAQVLQNERMIVAMIRALNLEDDPAFIDALTALSPRGPMRLQKLLTTLAKKESQRPT